eukprot:1141432-Pelagomonas_calceolata.AAC.3
MLDEMHDLDLAPRKRSSTAAVALCIMFLKNCVHPSTERQRALMSQVQDSLTLFSPYHLWPCSTIHEKVVCGAKVTYVRASEGCEGNRLGAGATISSACKWDHLLSLFGSPCQMQSCLK